MQKDRLAQTLRDDPFFALWAALRFRLGGNADFFSVAVERILDFVPTSEDWTSTDDAFGEATPDEALARLFSSNDDGEADARFFAAVEFVERLFPALRGVSDGADSAAKRIHAWSGAFAASDDGLTDLLRPMIAQLSRTGRIARDFDAALEREKLEAMAEFAAGAGHEMNNPLAVISGRAQLLLKGEKHPERRRDLALIHSQAMRVYEMIADMMLFSRPPTPQRKRFAFQDWLRPIVAEWEERSAEVGAKFRCLASSEDFEIEADPTQLAVAVGALCQNALEAIDEGGAFSLRFEKGAEDFVVRVCDDGPGVSPEERRHIFDPYYSARQAGRGLGLGLSKAWRIAEMHGGAIECKNLPEGGAEFTLRIPSAFGG